LCYLVISCAFWIVDLASSTAAFIHPMNSFTVSSPKGHCLGSRPIWGVRLVSSKNGVCWVEACTWLLCWNSTIGNRLYQLSCFLLTKSYRYWLSSWLTCSICPSVCKCQAIENTNQIPSSLEFSGETYHKLGSTVHVEAAHGASIHGGGTVICIRIK